MTQPTTPKQPKQHHRLGLLIILVGFVLSVYTLLPSLNTESISIVDSKDVSTVFFEAEKDQVLFPFQCLTVRWDVENIWSVYLEGEGVIGHDSRRWCIHESGNQPTLRVIFSENVEREYTLTVSVMTIRFSLLLGVVLVFTGVYITKMPPLIWLEAQIRARQALTTFLIY